MPARTKISTCRCWTPRGDSSTLSSVTTEPRETVPSSLVAETIEEARLLLLNRPERRNALVPELARRLTQEVSAADHDPGVRAIVLRGAGGHFSVGLDLKWYLSLGSTPAQSVLEDGLRAFQDVIRAIVRSPLPIVAVLEGNVAGFGLDLALACDMRIATHSVSLTSAFARMGLVPDGGSTYTLPLLVGMERAGSILMSGDTVDAERAQSIGLVSTVTSEDRLESVAVALVKRIAKQSRRSVAQIKELMNAEHRPALESRLELEGKAQLEALRSPEFGARLDAFLRGITPL